MESQTHESAIALIALQEREKKKRRTMISMSSFFKEMLSPFEIPLLLFEIAAAAAAAAGDFAAGPSNNPPARKASSNLYLE